MRAKRHTLIGSTVTVFLLAVFGSCDITTDLERDPLDVPLSEIIEIERIIRSELAADGIATDTVIARIPRDAKNRSITFAASKGGFVDAGGKGEFKTIAVPNAADPKHLQARATYVSDTLPGIATITGTLLTFSDTLLIQLVKIP